jgi:Holliday junction resolvase
MPNANYLAGRRKEWQTMRLLEAQGYLAMRMAGSHGPFDVIAANSTNILAIQVKTGEPATISPAEIEAIAEIKVPNNVAKQVWLWDKRARLPRVKEVR